MRKKSLLKLNLEDPILDNFYGKVFNDSGTEMRSL